MNTRLNNMLPTVKLVRFSPISVFYKHILINEHKLPEQETTWEKIPHGQQNQTQNAK